MPKFECTICHEQISYISNDLDIHAKHFFECPGCYSVIAKERYRRNIPKSRTLFGYMGFCLGDQIIQQAIKDFYLSQNPDEQVYFCAGEPITKEYLAEYRPNKLFWGDLSGWEIPKNAITFGMSTEANTLAGIGIYPKNIFGFAPVDWHGLSDRQYVVLHIRNIGRGSNLKKNCEPEYIRAIVEKLESWPVVIVGNDDIGEYDFPGQANIYDWRHQLTLPEIATVLKHCRLYVGKDSGIAHLAGTCGASGVVWGFQSKLWFPKVPVGQMQCYLRRHSNVETVLNAIESKINV